MRRRGAKRRRGGVRGGSSLPAKEGGPDRASDSGRQPVGRAPRNRPDDGVPHFFEDGFPCGALCPPAASRLWQKSLARRRGAKRRRGGVRGGSSLPAKEGGPDRASDSGRHPVGKAPRIRPDDGVPHLFEDGFPCGALCPPAANPGRRPAPPIRSPHGLPGAGCFRVRAAGARARHLCDPRGAHRRRRAAHLDHPGGRVRAAGAPRRARGRRAGVLPRRRELPRPGSGTSHRDPGRPGRRGERGLPRAPRRRFRRGDPPGGGPRSRGAPPDADCGRAGRGADSGVDVRVRHDLGGRGDAGALDRLPSDRAPAPARGRLRADDGHRGGAPADDPRRGVRGDGAGDHRGRALAGGTPALLGRRLPVRRVPGGAGGGGGVRGPAGAPRGRRPRGSSGRVRSPRRGTGVFAPAAGGGRAGPRPLRGARVRDPRPRLRIRGDLGRLGRRRGRRLPGGRAPGEPDLRGLQRGVSGDPGRGARLRGRARRLGRPGRGRGDGHHRPLDIAARRVAAARADRGRDPLRSDRLQLPGPLGERAGAHHAADPDPGRRPRRDHPAGRRARDPVGRRHHERGLPDLRLLHGDAGHGAGRTPRVAALLPADLRLRPRRRRPPGSSWPRRSPSGRSERPERNQT